jgi:hypothetical protein
VARPVSTSTATSCASATTPRSEAPRSSASVDPSASCAVTPAVGASTRASGASVQRGVPAIASGALAEVVK